VSRGSLPSDSLNILIPPLLVNDDLQRKGKKDGGAKLGRGREKMRYLLIVLPVLWSCFSNRLPRPLYWLSHDDRAVLDETVDWWKDKGLPWDESCEEQRPYIRFTILGGSEFEAQCNRCGPGSCLDGRVSNQCPYGCARACYHRRTYGNLFSHSAISIMVFHESQVHRLHDSMRHELRHWLEACSGLGRDPDHSNLDVWVY